MRRAETCRSCGAPLPARAAFCPACGARLIASGRPARRGIRANVVRVEPRLFGVPPATLVLVLAVGALAGGGGLVAAGRPLAGVLVGAAAVPLLAAFVAVARTHPDSGVARAAVRTVDAGRARLAFAVGLVSARARAREHLRRLHAEVGRLEDERAARLEQLGAAVYAGDERAARALRGSVRELDAVLTQKEADIEQVAAQTDERIRQVRLETQPTEAVEPGEPIVPEPARVPEPYPPGELTPPTPPATPEPYPPPDEGTPPVPPAIPEPYPPGEQHRS